MFFWNSGQLKISNNISVVINPFSQLYYLTPPMETISTFTILTHMVSKTFAGIGALDISHNISVAYFKDQAATTSSKLSTGINFGIGAMASN